MGCKANSEEVFALGVFALCKQQHVLKVEVQECTSLCTVLVSHTLGIMGILKLISSPHLGNFSLSPRGIGNIPVPLVRSRCPTTSLWTTKKYPINNASKPIISLENNSLRKETTEIATRCDYWKTV